MNEISTKLFLTEEIVLPLEALALLPTEIVCRRLSKPSEFAEQADGAVLLVTPKQAQELLVATRSSENFVIIIWSATGRETIKPELLHHPKIVGALNPACSPVTIWTALKSAFALIGRTNHSIVEGMLEQVLKVGRALASEKDLNALLSLILTHARDLTAADGASIYTFNNDKRLCFHLWQNSSTTVDAGQLPVGEDSIAGYVARTGGPLAIEDAYGIAADAPYRFNSEQDRLSGYRTCSLLTVPLKNKADKVLGVLQLINRKTHAGLRLTNPDDCERYVLPFSPRDQLIAFALAGQAGVALENSLLYADIERLFEGFIKASVQAIEARDPVTAGHSFRVAGFTEQLARAVDRADQYGLRDVVFSSSQLRELRYAALLHDFGKVGVKEEVLVKSKKLYPLQLELIKQRFKYARLHARQKAYQKLLDFYEQQVLTPAEFSRRRQELEQAISAEVARLEKYWQIVLNANEPTVSPQEVSAELSAITAYYYVDEGAGERPLLDKFEFADLALGKGSLSAKEREQIESHVSHTYTFLSLIPWTADLSNLPEIAYAHHEKLDGSGYPRRLNGAEIPIQSKIMTIADIYDALTASDRPYKQALPPAQALDILQEEANKNKIDPNLLRVFIEAEAYRVKT
jgi:HD-GYP domain-containing protein (c-di-GMP phosphodiesterase class II)